MSRLHRFSDGPDELGPQGIEIELITESDGERVDRARGVVALSSA